MLSASFNQNSNQGLRFNLSDNPMNEFVYHENYNPNAELYGQYFSNGQFQNNVNKDAKMYSINEVDSLIHSNVGNGQIEQDFDLGMLSSRLQSMGLKQANMSRSNSAHNSPFDSRVTPRTFSQSTSNTPVSLANRMCRDADIMRGNPPIMQLFPTNNMPPMNNNYNVNRQSPVELIEYQSIASKMGFLVGQDLEEVLSRSATMKNSNSSRISNFFKHKHGSSGGVHNAVKQYLVIGVRVPSKEHVSEIVGKEGKKIKMIRQTTGALIATPNEKEDHVFLIEAVPDIALKVGQMIQQLADQISRNKLGNIVGLGERPRSPPVLGNRTPLATASIGVPQRLVGKVIGTQGSIITTVQKETGTEIKSPPKDELRAPEDNADFEISVYENGTVNSEETAWLQIHRAKQLIAHLVMRVWDQQPRNSTPSSDEGQGGHVMSGSQGCPEWIWPEVARMDDGDAKEIVDRILRSSKAKITPSTSSAEGAVDGVNCPGMSPPSYMNSYKIFPTINDSHDEWSGRAHMDLPFQTQSLQQQHQRSNQLFSDSAFYEPSYYYQDSGYMQDNNNSLGYHCHQDSYQDMTQQHHQNGVNVVPESWSSKVATFNGITHNNGANHYSTEDSKFGNLKNIWKSDVFNEFCEQKPVIEPTFGTIGDGRKRYSVASDDREDL